MRRRTRQPPRVAPTAQLEVAAEVVTQPVAEAAEAAEGLARWARSKDAPGAAPGRSADRPRGHGC